MYLSCNSVSLAQNKHKNQKRVCPKKPYLKVKFYGLMCCNSLFCLK